MFKNSGKSESTSKKSAGTNPSSHSINTLVGGTMVDGDIVAQNDFRIDGKLTGKLKCAGKVIIGPDGIVEGSITCQNALIEGIIKGDVQVEDLLTVMDSGNIVGNIKTDRLIVHAGAKFNVNCDMAGVEAAQKQVESKSKRKEQETKGLVFDA